MGTDIATIKGTGRFMESDLTIKQFASKNGLMVQLTQGFGLTADEPKFIQLSTTDAYKLIVELAVWIKKTTCDRAKELQAEINKNGELKNTIFQDAVNCQKFIDDLEIIKIPLRLLS
jgi:hypothetical protein